MSIFCVFFHHILNVVMFSGGVEIIYSTVFIHVLCTMTCETLHASLGHTLTHTHTRGSNGVRQITVFWRVFAMQERKPVCRQIWGGWVKWLRSFTLIEKPTAHWQLRTGDETGGTGTANEDQLMNRRKEIRTRHGIFCKWLNWIDWYQ